MVVMKEDRLKELASLCGIPEHELRVRFKIISLKGIFNALSLRRVNSTVKDKS